MTYNATSQTLWGNQPSGNSPPPRLTPLPHHETSIYDRRRKNPQVNRTRTYFYRWSFSLHFFPILGDNLYNHSSIWCAIVDEQTDLECLRSLTPPLRTIHISIYTISAVPVLYPDSIFFVPDIWGVRRAVPWQWPALSKTSYNAKLCRYLTPFITRVRYIATRQGQRYAFFSLQKSLGLTLLVQQSIYVLFCNNWRPGEALALSALSYHCLLKWLVTMCKQCTAKAIGRRNRSLRQRIYDYAFSEISRRAHGDASCNNV